MKTLSLLLMLCLSCGLYAQETAERTTREAIVNKSTLLTRYPDGSLNAEQRDSSGMILFQYQYTAAQQEGVADDEYTEQLVFTIAPDKTGKFVLTGKQLEAAQAHFYKGCFCANRGTFAIVSGTIIGTRMSKTEWYLNINVKFKTSKGDQQQTVTKKIKGLYTIVSQN